MYTTSRRKHISHARCAVVGTNVTWVAVRRVSFAIKDGLSCGRGVQLPSVRFAAIIWICHGVSFDCRPLRWCQVISSRFFLIRKLFDWQLRSRKSEVTPVPLCPTSKGKTICGASIQPSTPSPVVYFVETFALFAVARNKPLYLEWPEQAPLRNNQTKANWKDETMIEHNVNWVVHISSACTLVTYVSLVRASAPLSQRSTRCTQTSPCSTGDGWTFDTVANCFA